MNFWVGLAVTAVVVLAVAAMSSFWVISSASKEKVTPLTRLNPGGNAGHALLVFHPGLSDFPARVTSAFAEGLTQSGWSVDSTTASSEAPVTVADYDLIILGSPIYGGVMAKPASDYIARVADFAGKPVAIILAAAGETDAGLQAAEASVRALNGNVVGRWGFTTMRPNESAKPYAGSNVEVAIQMARDEARALKLTAAE